MTQIHELTLEEASVVAGGCKPCTPVKPTPPTPPAPPTPTKPCGTFTFKGFLVAIFAALGVRISFC